MRVKDLAKKYGVTARSVQYWTDLGLLTVDGTEPNGFRQYGEQAEEELKLILICEAAGLKVDAEHVRFVELMPKDMMESLIGMIENERKKATQHFDQAIRFARERG